MLSRKKIKTNLVSLLGKKIVSFSAFFILHPYLFFKSLLLTLRFFLVNRFNFFRDLFYKKNLVNKSVAVSLTTYSARINSVYLTIESIISQDIRPQYIYLWLYKGDIPSNGLPESLTKLEKFGLRIVVLDDNQMSYKKLSYMLDVVKELGLDYILTADDDVFYPEFWMKRLLDKAQVERTSVVCFRGHDLDDSFDYWKSMKNNTSKDKPSAKLLPTGVCGVLYPVDALDARIRDFSNINAICYKADDIWYKFVTLSNGYDSCRVLENNVCFPLLLSSLHEGLQDENVLNDENNNKLIQTSKHFGLKEFQ